MARIVAKIFCKSSSSVELPTIFARYFHSSLPPLVSSFFFLSCFSIPLFLFSFFFIFFNSQYTVTVWNFVSGEKVCFSRQRRKSVSFFFFFFFCSTFPPPGAAINHAKCHHVKMHSPTRTYQLSLNGEGSKRDYDYRRWKLCCHFLTRWTWRDVFDTDIEVSKKFLNLSELSDTRVRVGWKKMEIKICKYVRTKLE